MKIAYLTATPIGDNHIRAALQGAIDPARHQIIELSELSRSSAAIDTLSEFLSHADLVVAHVGRRSQNLFYEIGLAHGLRKPVLLVTKNPAWIPMDLQGQQIIRYDMRTDALEKVAFVLRAWLSQLERFGANESNLLGLAFAEKTTSQFSPARNQNVLGRASPFHSELERRVAEQLARVPGWEVTEAAPDQRERTCDFVVWNHLQDPVLSILGNPIAFEVKGNLSKQLVQQWARTVSTQGLRGLVFITSIELSGSKRASFAKIGRRAGISIVALDRRDILEATEPNYLPRKLRERLLELRAV